MSSPESTASPETPSYEELAACNELLEQKLELANFKIKELQKHIFGRSSEKRHAVSKEQASLFEEDSFEEAVSLEESESITVREHTKCKRRSKKEFPKDLPVEEVVYEPHETHCTDCGGELQEFSRDVRDELDFNPASFFRRKVVTVHCSCPRCKKTVSGEVLPEHKPVIPGSQIGAGFLSHLMTSRHADHLPYYRQSQMYERLGVYFPDKTLSRYGLHCGMLLQPVARAIKKELLKLSYLQADETRQEVLDKEKSPNTHTGQLWVLSDPLGDLTYYEYHTSRCQNAATSFLDGYTGALQTDGYVCYDKHKGVHIGCWSHARRYFVKAEELTPKECKHVLKLIGKLNRIEKELKKERGNQKTKKWYARRLKVRRERSVKILEQLRAYLTQLKDKWVLEEHPLYKALHYTLSRWDQLCLYTTNGEYEIDNNHVERKIRPIAIGRRNWLFSGSHYGAQMSAVMMTVINTCKHMKINPQQYLKDVLPKLAQRSRTTDPLTELTPFDWKKS